MTTAFTLLLIPLIGAVAMMFAPAKQAKWIALVASTLTFVINFIAALAFKHWHDGGYGLEGSVDLLPQFGINLSTGADSVSMLLILLTTLLMPLCVWGSFSAINDRLKEYYGWLLVIETAMVGVFLARDLVLFYVCFELTLVPMFFLIAIYGGDNRSKASFKFFIFTFTGSLIALAGLLYVAWYHQSQTGTWSFDIQALTLTAQKLHEVTVHLTDTITTTADKLVLLALLCGFAVKVPLFPLHTWLPLAHTEAPTAGSVVLAGVLLKLGTYGLYRFVIPMVPDAVIHYGPAIAVLCIIGILYAALICWVQSDIKKLVAYSSVSHLGFCVLGLVALNPLGVQGSVMYMLNHGLSTGALFFLVGMIYERYHTRDMNKIGGLAKVMPVWAFFMVFFVLSSVGLPGLNGFIGEFLCLIGAFTAAPDNAAYPGVLGPWYAAFAAVGMIFAAMYLLIMTGKVVWGPLKEPNGHGHGHSHAASDGALPRDLSLREIGVLVPLAVLCVYLGFRSPRITDTLEKPIDQILAVYPAKVHEAVRMAKQIHPQMSQIAQMGKGREHELRTSPYLRHLWMTSQFISTGTTPMADKLWFILPELSLFAGVIAVFVLGLSPRKQVRDFLPWISCAFLTLALGLTLVVYESAKGQEILSRHSFLLMPLLGKYIKIIVCVMGIALTLVSVGLIDRRLEAAVESGRLRFDAIRANRGEFHAFFLLSLIGVMLVCNANDLIWLFLALELTSLPTYIMVAISRPSKKAQEAAVKYFFLGALAAAMFLYGFALLYGATGTMVLTEMRDRFNEQVQSGGVNPIGIVGMILALLGVSYKIAAAPMHFYAPDVYEGAAAPVTAFLAFVPKTTGMVAIILLLSTIGWGGSMTEPGLPKPIITTLWMVAVLTMTLGNVGAILQKSVKRVLAYSSIAHSGYMLIGVIAGPAQRGIEAVLFYLLAYGIMNTAAFAVLAGLERRGQEIESMEDLAGLRVKHPGMAAVMAIASGSLLGVPPLLGFWGKLYLFIAGVQAGQIVLVVIAGLNSAISAWYYLRLISLPIMGKPSAQSETIVVSPFRWPRVAGVVTAAAVVVLPAFIGPLFKASALATSTPEVAAQSLAGAVHQQK